MLFYECFMIVTFVAHAAWLRKQFPINNNLVKQLRGLKRFRAPR